MTHDAREIPIEFGGKSGRRRKESRKKQSGLGLVLYAESARIECWNEPRPTHSGRAFRCALQLSEVPRNGGEADDDFIPNAEQEERLTAVLNLLGFADIDTLEEYVCLHGGVSIVATRAPVEETQSQFPPSTQRRASKYQARKEELADSRHTAQILEREYEREKLELKRTLERANDEIYNKEVEVRKRVAAVEMLEGLQADFKELDDFALEKRQELNVAYDDLDAFDLALKEADTKALELQGEVLDLQRELEQERELRIAGEKSIVEKDIEIANLQQRLAQLTPAHTSSNTTLDSSTSVHFFTLSCCMPDDLDVQTSSTSRTSLPRTVRRTNTIPTRRITSPLIPHRQSTSHHDHFPLPPFVRSPSLFQFRRRLRRSCPSRSGRRYDWTDDPFDRSGAFGTSRVLPSTHL